MVNFNSEVHGSKQFENYCFKKLFELISRNNRLHPFQQTTKAIVEEAIHFADCLLTPTAFQGVPKESVEPMFTLLGEEGWEPIGIMTEESEVDDSCVANAAAHIVNHASVTWENYFVAPSGNQPIHPNLGRDDREKPTVKN